MLKFGLFTRIAISLTVILCSAMLALGYVIVKDAEQQFQQEHLRLVSASAKTLASGSLDALVTRDFELLERWVTSVLLDDFYAYSFLANADGQILTHSDLELVARHTEPVGQLTETLIRDTFYKNEPVREVIYPARVGEQHLANAHVAYYHNREAMNQQSTFKVVCLIVGSLILMLAATLLIIRRYTQPIRQLTHYVSQLNLDSSDATIQPHLLQDSDEIGVLSRAFDDMYKRLMAAFVELRQEELRLREQVDEQTRDLQQTNRELESFSYSVSHDLRAPLRTIDGFSLMLAEDYGDKLGAEGHNTIVRIRLATQRMSCLIDDMLELSRISQTPLATKNVNLSALVREAVKELQSTAPQRKAVWTLAPEAEVRGDVNLLRILIVNLLDNAWKYSAKTQQVKIEFGICNVDNKTTYFIRDNGAGFDMEYKDMLFKPFSRLHGSDQFEGTGVGLATVRRILERHHGKIWAESTPDEGATFYFQLG